MYAPGPHHSLSCAWTSYQLSCHTDLLAQITSDSLSNSIISIITDTDRFGKKNCASWSWSIDCFRLSFLAPQFLTSDQYHFCHCTCIVYQAFVLSLLGEYTILVWPARSVPLSYKPRHNKTGEGNGSSWPARLIPFWLWLDYAKTHARFYHIIYYGNQTTDYTT